MTRPPPMQCEVVHAIPGRVRLRLDEESSSNGHAREVGALFSGRPEVRSVRMNRDARSMVVVYDPAACDGPTIVKKVREAARDVERDDDRPDGAASLESEEDGWPLVLATLAIALGGSAVATACLAGAALPIFHRAFASLRDKQRLNVDVLDAAATSVLVAQGQLQTAAVMVWLVALGDAIRDLTVHRSRRAIEGLFRATATQVWVVREGATIAVRADEVRAGDAVVVYPGELIPVDGTVRAGTALVDQKLVTGESLPVEKTEGASVYAGTALVDGKLHLEAARAGRETVAARIARFVRDAPVGETRVQNYAERFADRVVPWSFGAAAASVIATGRADGAAALLIIDYGTGIRVAAPTTILATLGALARRGIVVKGGRVLERLAEVDAVIFDKTATLTAGTPEVEGVTSLAPTLAEDRVLALAAAAEVRFGHPVAGAIVKAARRRRLAIPERSASAYQVGMGVQATVEGAVIHVGCDRFIRGQGIALDRARAALAAAAARAASAVLVARDGELIGVLTHADPIRPEAPAVLRALRARGVAEIAMVTGDAEPVAADVARRLGIARVIAEALPDDKRAVLRALQREGRRVAVVGDGINDSPALVDADVGIAVHGGADVARVAADVLFIEGSLWKLVRTIDLAREAQELVAENWALLLYPNTAAIALALVGAIGPVGATLISNGSAIVASVNALRPLLGWSGAR